MAFVEQYQDHYSYVPFYTKSWVDCRPKKRLLKNSVVDKQVLEKMSTYDLMQIVNGRNIDIIEKIIAKRVKEQNAIANQTTIEEVEVEKQKHIVKKRNIQLLQGLANAPRYDRIYGVM